MDWQGLANVLKESAPIVALVALWLAYKSERQGKVREHQVEKVGVLYSHLAKWTAHVETILKALRNAELPGEDSGKEAVRLHEELRICFLQNRVWFPKAICAAFNKNSECIRQLGEVPKGRTEAIAYWEKLFQTFIPLYRELEKAMRSLLGT